MLDVFRLVWKYTAVFRDLDIAGLSRIYCINRIIEVISMRTVNKCESVSGELAQEARGAAMSELHSEWCRNGAQYSFALVRVFTDIR